MEPDRIDLIGLVSEKNIALRKTCEQQWNSRGGVKVTTSEWYVLSHIQGRRLSVSDLARAADLTRQAIHKRISSLRDKGLLEVTTLPHNKRARYVSLTLFGQQCRDEYDLLKQELELKIAEILGDEKIRSLKEMLQTDWLN